MQTFLEEAQYGEYAEYKYVFDSSLGQITGKDVIAHLNPLRSKPRVFCLSLIGENLVFPVKEVDKYLKRIDKIGKRIINLKLWFDSSNSVELLDMIVARFPHTEQLYLNYSDEHPIEHCLERLSQLSNLQHIDFPFGVQKVLECMQKHQLAPLARLSVLTFKRSLFNDKYSHYEAILPVLFPNLIKLVVACTGKVLEDIEANIRTLLPKLDFVHTFDIGTPEDEIWNHIDNVRPAYD